MTLVKCPECGKTISDKAAFCPDCGNQFNTAVTNTTANNHFPNNANMYNANQYNPNPYVQYAPKIPGRGFGISSMVFGIIGIFYSFCALIASIAIKGTADNPLYSRSYKFSEADTSMAIIIIFSLFLASLSLIFGFCSHSKGCKSGVKTAGFVLGGISLALCLISFMITSSI